MAADDDDKDIPENGAVYTFGKSKFADNVPNKFYIRNDRVLQVTCGDEHTTLVAESGRVFTFGSNEYGQLGLGHTNPTTKPMCIKSMKQENVTHAACGRAHTLLATVSGHIYSFGSNGESQLGVEDMPGSNTPRLVESAVTTPYKMLAAGTDHSLALTENGRVYVWGSGSEGQLGLGEETEAPHPTLLPFDDPIICIACGYYHSAIVTDSGVLYTFGESEGGKLGLGDDPEESDTPQPVSGIPGRVTWVACGGMHTVAVTENGDTYTFGDGANGQLGQGTALLQLSHPRRVPLEARVRYCDCGDNHTALVSDLGHVYTFGDGRHGKLALGNESFANQFVPRKVARFRNLSVNKVACGGCHMMVMAQPRHVVDDVPVVINGHASPDLERSGSVSARDRRRMNGSPSASLSRTLPALSLSRPLPPLTATHPPCSLNSLSVPVLPRVNRGHSDKSYSGEGHSTDDSEGETRQPVVESFITQAVIEINHSSPNLTPRPVPRLRRSPRSEDRPDSESQSKPRVTSEKQEIVDEKSDEDSDEGSGEDRLVKIEEEPEDKKETKNIKNKIPVPRRFGRHKSDGEEGNVSDVDENDEDNIEDDVDDDGKNKNENHVEARLAVNGAGDEILNESNDEDVDEVGSEGDGSLKKMSKKDKKGKDKKKKKEKDEKDDLEEKTGKKDKKNKRDKKEKDDKKDKDKNDDGDGDDGKTEKNGKKGKKDKKKSKGDKEEKAKEDGSKDEGESDLEIENKEDKKKGKKDSKKDKKAKKVEKEKDSGDEGVVNKDEDDIIEEMDKVGDEVTDKKKKQKKPGRSRLCTIL